MKLFIWQDVNNVTTEYHDGGSLLVVASDLDEAIEFVEQDREERCAGKSDRYDVLAKQINRYSYDKHKDVGLADLPPDHVFELADAVEPAVIIFPDSGCC